MLNKLRVKFTLICSLTMGIILAFMCIFYLYISETQVSNQSDIILKNNLNSLVYNLQSSKIVDNAWLSQLESGNKIIIHIEDCNKPLLFKGSYKTQTPRSKLIEIAQEKAFDTYAFNIRNKPELITNVNNVTFEIYGDNNEKYQAALAVIPSGESWHSITIIRDLNQDNIEKIKTRIVFFITVIILTVVMLYFSWWFAGKAIEPIAKSNKQQMEFVAAASHELRSPVTVMNLSISALEKSKTESDSKKFLSSVKYECSRMARLINDLLLLANSDIKTLSFKYEQYDIQTILINIYETYKQLATSKNQHIDLDLPYDSFPLLYGDSQRIYQALSAILDNSLFYTPSEGKIKISSTINKKSIIIYIIDNGIGIKDINKLKVFERFFREDVSRNKKEHYGLGLSIVKEIINMHSGKIYIHDTKGGGTTFVIELPIKLYL